MPYDHLRPNRLLNDERISLFVDYCGDSCGQPIHCEFEDYNAIKHSPFNDMDDIDICISPYLRYLDKDSSTDRISIEFGRGNHLTLNKKYIDDIINFSENLFYSYSFKNINIEVSTSLTGNFNTQLDVAKRLIDAERSFYGRVSFSFIIVANANIENGNYWNKIRSFFKIIETHRELLVSENLKESNTIVLIDDRDRCYDMILLNISPTNIPDIHLVYRHITGLGASIGLSWWLNESVKSIISETDINNIEEFLYKFVSYPSFSDIDCSFSKTISSFGLERKRFKKKDLSSMIKESMTKHSISINADGNVMPSFLTPFGIVEESIINSTSNDCFYSDIHHAIDIHTSALIKAASESSACSTCTVRDICIHTGVINIGMMNISNMGNNKISSKICPAGSSKFIKHILKKTTHK